MEKVERLLESFEFLGEDARWAGAVELVNQTVPQGDGSAKEYINVRLRIGQGSRSRSMPLPRRGLENIVSALQSAKTAADAHYEQRVLEMSTTMNRNRERNR